MLGTGRYTQNLGLHLLQIKEGGHKKTGDIQILAKALSPIAMTEDIAWKHDTEKQTTRRMPCSKMLTNSQIM